MPKFANKRGQGLTEYVILLSIVAAALLAMQIYLQRGLQLRHRDGIKYLLTSFLEEKTGRSNLPWQFEPYSFEKEMTVGKEGYTAGGFNVEAEEYETDITTTRKGYERYVD